MVQPVFVKSSGNYASIFVDVDAARVWHHGPRLAPF